MHRRTLLASGLALAGATTTAGCLGQDGDDGDDGGDEPAPEPGFALEPEDVPAPDVDVDALERNTDNAEPVPLLPIEAAYDWYRRRDARFVDARSLTAYEAGHVAGAVHSPAPTGYSEDDPVDDWPDDERIVTYCTCPHHYSTARASSLLQSGHEAVFAIDEGFRPWEQNGYPVASSDGGQAVLGEARTIRGRVDSAYAGELARVRHEPTGQREPAEISADGSFQTTIYFVDVDAGSPLTVETPAWTETAPLSAWVDETVR